MLFYDFANYEEFKEIFGIIEHGNGVKSRKNKILLALYKDKDALRQHIRAKEYQSLTERMVRVNERDDNRLSYCNRHAFVHRDKIRALFRHLDCKRDEIPPECWQTLLVKTLPVLKSRLLDILTLSCYHLCSYHNWLDLAGHRFYSSLYQTDDMQGICEDGALNFIRYRNVEKDKVYKMKAGKMFNHLLSENRITRGLPEQIKRWLSEEFVADWILHTTEFFSEGDFQLHVDDDFNKIYSLSDFGSCMTNHGYHTFYRDAVDAKAAYLTNDEGRIVARCVIYMDVEDEDGKKWRLAERQYSLNSQQSLQRILVCRLIKGGYIDGYKKVGASCHDARGFVDNQGNSLEGKRFSIDCHLEPGDYISYQDSFKWYDEGAGIADNYGQGCYDLATTDGYYRQEDSHDDDFYSDTHGEWINEDDARYVETRNDYFYDNEVAYGWRMCSDGRFYEEDLHEDDVIVIDGEYYYAGYECEDPEGHGLCRCPHCDEWFIPGRGDSCYSEVRDEDYCCSDCRDEAERIWYNDNGFVQSDWDDEWYLEEEIIVANEWYCNRWWETKIHIGKFNDLVEEGKATGYLGEYYIDKVNSEGEPVHFERISVAI